MNHKFDEFTHSYLVTAIWASIDENGEPLDRRFTLHDLSDEAIARAKEDCGAFQKEYGCLFIGKETEAGNDYWLTRNRHGAGFWDGDWPEEKAAQLTEASHADGEICLYEGDDGKLYFG